MLHESKNIYCDAAMIMAEASAAEMQHSRVLLAIQDLPILQGGRRYVAKGFWDSGATICLCTHDWARRNGLVGSEAAITQLHENNC